MGAGFSDLLSLVGVWLGGRKRAVPPVAGAPGDVALQAWAQSYALLDIDTSAVVLTAHARLASLVLNPLGTVTLVVHRSSEATL